MALRPERLPGSQASDAPDHSRRRAAPLTQGRTESAWAALGLLLAISIFSYADRYLMSALAAAWAPDTASAMTCAVLAGVLGGGRSVGVMAGFQYVLPKRARATGTARALLVVALGGTALGPWLTGVLSDAFGGGAGGLRLALSLVIPTGALGALAPWRAAGALDPTG